MKDDLNKIIELIDSINNAAKYGEVELIGSEEAFEKLRESGFPLHNYKYWETPYADDSQIFIIPCESKPFKLYFDGD